MKEFLLILYIFFATAGCASLGELYTRGVYTETVCTKKLFRKEECKEVTKEGLHAVKKIKVRGVGADFSFKDGEETGKGATLIPDFSGLQLKNQ